METPKKTSGKASGKTSGGSAGKTPSKASSKSPGKAPDKTTGRTPVDTTELWEKAEHIFLKGIDKADYPSKKSDITLQNLIADVTTFATKPEGDEVKGAKRVKTNSILQKLELVLEFGDKAMVAAPEFVSLAWLGIRMIANVSLCLKCDENAPG